MSRIRDRRADCPEELSYGTEYGREAINRALQSANPYDIVPSRDTEGHGTFMAGVACGNEDAAQEFSGIAPLAELVVVKCKAAKRNIRDYYGIDPDVPCFMENDIMLGIRYLARIAYRRRKPMVVCIGMGTSLGSHYRGGALGHIAQSYGDLRGFVVVAAGGNEGNESHHYHQEQLAARGETEVELRVDPAETDFTTELWCKAPGLCSVALISPGGEFSGRIYARVGERQMIRFLLEKTVVYIDYLLVSFESGDECIRLRFFGPEEGIWRFRVYNETDIPAQFDMWLPIREFINNGTYFLRPDPNTTLCDPSNNLQIITVSYYDGANRSVAAQASRGFNVRGEIAPGHCGTRHQYLRSGTGARQCGGGARQTGALCEPQRFQCCGGCDSGGCHSSGGVGDRQGQRHQHGHGRRTEIPDPRSKPGRTPLPKRRVGVWHA